MSLIIQRLGRKIAILSIAMIPATTTLAAADMDTLAQGIWVDREAIKSLPMQGPAWDKLLSHAQVATDTPNISDQDDRTNVLVFAKALVYMRTGEERYRNEVIKACMNAIGTEDGGRTLALGRNLMAFVLAADLVGLPADKDRIFREWLEEVLDEQMWDGRSLRLTNAHRPNNWGNHAGASRLAVAAYLGNADEIDEVARIFKGYLGDRSSYADFRYGGLDWQADPENPVGINPKGATKEGHSIDGVLPDDQRRAADGTFTWPPPTTNYAYEGLQGAVAQAVLLTRAGYDAFEWENQALLRAFQWLHEQANFPTEGDDTWQPYIINGVYGTNFPAAVPSSPGKAIGYTDWSHEVGLPRPQNLRLED